MKTYGRPCADAHAAACMSMLIDVNIYEQPDVPNKGVKSVDLAGRSTWFASVKMSELAWSVLLLRYDTLAFGFLYVFHVHEVASTHPADGYGKVVAKRDDEHAVAMEAHDVALETLMYAAYATYEHLVAGIERGVVLGEDDTHALELVEADEQTHGRMGDDGRPLGSAIVAEVDVVEVLFVDITPYFGRHSLDEDKAGNRWFLLMLNGFADTFKLVCGMHKGGETLVYYFQGMLAQQFAVDERVAPRRMVVHLHLVLALACKDFLSRLSFRLLRLVGCCYGFAMGDIHVWRHRYVRFYMSATPSYVAFPLSQNDLRGHLLQVRKADVGLSLSRGDTLLMQRYAILMTYATIVELFFSRLENRIFEHVPTFGREFAIFSPSVDARFHT